VLPVVEAEIPQLTAKPTEPRKRHSTDVVVSASAPSEPTKKQAPELSEKQLAAAQALVSKSMEALNKNSRPEKSTTSSESESTKPAKVASYEDAATVLIRKDKAARQALIKTFKSDAAKLVDLADLGDDIWTRVIEAAEELPEK
jgi:predicted carbohydrate-binding protein with CBM5 and CBM33 domain